MYTVCNKYLVYSLIENIIIMSHNTVYKFNTVICWLIIYNIYSVDKVILTYMMLQISYFSILYRIFMMANLGGPGVYWLLQLSLTKCPNELFEAMCILRLVACFGIEVLIYSSTLETSH